MNSVSAYVKPILPFDCPSSLHSFSVSCGLGFVKRSNTFYEKKVGKKFNEMAADWEVT